MSHGSVGLFRRLTDHSPGHRRVVHHLISSHQVWAVVTRSFRKLGGACEGGQDSKTKCNTLWSKVVNVVPLKRSRIGAANRSCMSPFHKLRSVLAHLVGASVCTAHKVLMCQRCVWEGCPTRGSVLVWHATLRNARCGSPSCILIGLLGDWALL